MKCLILIPAYNCEKTLPDVLKDLDTFSDIDILVINDGSTDATEAIAAAEGVEIVSHSQNKGKGAALKTGFAYAREHHADVVITLDADGQHPVDKIADLLREHAAYPKAVILGRRQRDKHMPWTRKFSNSVSALLISWRIGQRIYDAQCGFRLIPTAYLNWHFSDLQGFIFESECLIALALNHVEFKFIPIPTIYPKYGQTKMTYFDSTFGFIFMYISSFFKSYKQDQHGL